MGMTDDLEVAVQEGVDAGATRAGAVRSPSGAATGAKLGVPSVQEEPMPTMWRKAMLYLGLGPDEEYDDYDAAYDDGYVDARLRARRGARRRPPVQVPDTPEPSAIGAVRAIRTVDSARPRPFGHRSHPPSPGRPTHSRGIRTRNPMSSPRSRSTRRRRWPTSSRATSR